MNIIKTARSADAVQKTDEAAAASSREQPDPLTGEPVSASVRHRAVGPAMSETMRTIVWITGVAFGVAAPGVFAQSNTDAGNTQKNPVFQKLDTDHDGFVSREEAKKDQAVNGVFDQADTSKDGKLDEDEVIKAISISQREKAERIAVNAGSAANQFALDSEITARVKSDLLREEGLRSLEISVQTYKGRVQLAGFVDSRKQVVQAGKIAARASGVKSVLNDLTPK